MMENKMMITGVLFMATTLAACATPSKITLNENGTWVGGMGGLFTNFNEVVDNLNSNDVHYAAVSNLAATAFAQKVTKIYRPSGYEMIPSFVGYGASQSRYYTLYGMAEYVVAGGVTNAAGTSGVVNLDTALAASYAPTTGSTNYATYAQGVLATNAVIDLTPADPDTTTIGSDLYHHMVVAGDLDGINNFEAISIKASSGLNIGGFPVKTKEYNDLNYAPITGSTNYASAAQGVLATGALQKANSTNNVTVSAGYLTLSTDRTYISSPYLNGTMNGNGFGISSLKNLSGSGVGGISGFADPTGGTGVGDRDFNDNRYASLSGPTFTGPINMGYNHITNAYDVMSRNIHTSLIASKEDNKTLGSYSTANALWYLPNVMPPISTNSAAPLGYMDARYLLKSDGITTNLNGFVIVNGQITGTY